MTRRLRHRGGLRLVVALCALLGAGCWPGRVPQVGETPPKVADGAAEAEYQRILERSSDHKELYAAFDTRLFCAATHLTGPFREARARRLALFTDQPPAVLGAQLAEERAALAAGNEVLLGVHVNEPRFDDFDRKSSIWRIALVTSAGEFAPTAVERVGRANLNLRAFYPYLGDFWVQYRVKFAKDVGGVPVIPEADQTVKLVVASTLGRAVLLLPAH